MQALIIRLSKIEPSAQSSLKVQNYLIEQGIDARFLEGTYGSEAQQIFKQEGRTLHPVSFKGNPPDSDYTASSMRPGVMGCFHSHYRCWKYCAEINEPILIFEDDVIFERGFMPVEWEDVLLVATGKRVFEHEFYSEKLYTPSGEPAAVQFKGKVMPGAVGYGLTPQGANKLLETYKKTFMPADNCLNMSVVMLQCHNYLMGRAALDGDGKKSLTKSRMWYKFDQTKTERQ